jgi:hypothetical protein
MMKVIDVSGLRIATDSRQDATGGIDADDIVRLARGEHLGARHDAALEALAASPAARDAFRVARAIESDARALACGIAATRGSNVVTLARPVPRTAAPMRFAAAAAVGFVAIGAALFGWQGFTPHAAAPVAATSPESDLIFLPSDEAMASADRRPAGDELFVDAFGG